MAKTKHKLALPKRIGGVKLPKKARKQANKLLKPFARTELKVLLGVVVAALAAHYEESTRAKGDAGAEPGAPEKSPTLKKRLAQAAITQLSH